jgi:acetoacetyl-CoA synthetase
VVAVPSMPRNLTGKKLELPVERILAGAEPDAVVGRDAVADAAALDAVVSLAARRVSAGTTARG